MAELSKLLAFMFKEDKEDILAQYNRLLDEADDEQALLESFGSPTKLAVTISRTYKRSERKLAVEADSREDKPAAEHLIVTPVKKEKEKPKVIDTGLSYADIIEEIRREKAAEEGIEYKPMFYDEPEKAPSEPAPEPEDTPEETAAEAVEAVEAVEAEAEQEPAEQPAPAEEETQDEPEKTPEEPGGEETVVDEAGAEPQEDEPETAEPEESAAEEPGAADETQTRETGEDAAEAAEPENEPEAEAELVFEELESEDIFEEPVRYKTNVALLILYLIFAIPVGLVLLVLSIALTVALLGLGALVIAAGAKIIAFAFSSLVIFADIMLCAGAVLIAFAVALVLLWLGILMLVRGIGGVVGGVVSLGRKLCVREVPVNG